jgi:hypothetical protein
LRCVLLLCTLAAGVGAARAQALGGDAAAKAKLVATMARFVHWPAAAFDSETAPLHLCVFAGSPTVQRAFQQHQDSLIGAHPLRTVINPGGAFKTCRIVFVDDSSNAPLERLLRHLADEPAFTVGTRDGFVSDGGMVEIVHVDNTLRFDVNLIAVREAGLGVNPGVLKLARQVKQ